MTPIKSRIKQYPATIYIYKEQTFLVLPKSNTAGIWHSKKFYNGNDFVFEKVFFSIIAAIILEKKRERKF